MRIVPSSASKIDNATYNLEIWVPIRAVGAQTLRGTESARDEIVVSITLIHDAMGVMSLLLPQQRLKLVREVPAMPRQFWGLRGYYR